jgi:predicted oxidoreductase
MRIQTLSPAEAERFVQAALELGANFFDHADIYGGGACEEMFAEAVHMSPSVRETLLLQSKVGIRAGMYDFSKEHILSAVEGCLTRLKTEYLDVLLLHRPDALVEPEEVAEAFNILESTGKVRLFGVSNHKPMQIALLKKFVRQPLHVNQLQLSIAHAALISNGLHVNTSEDAALDRDGSVLDYCRLHDITIQPWSPFQHGFFGGVFVNNPDFPELNACLNQLAEKYKVSSTTIALAWLLRHPARMQPIVGTMNPARLKECAQASEITLSRQEWYSIYRAAGNTLP